MHGVTTALRTAGIACACVMTITLPVTLIVGASVVGKSSVAACLLARGNGSACGGTSVAADASASIWSIDNKYYTALSVLREIGVSQGASDAEALVLMCSCGQPSSFDAVRAWAEASGCLEAETKLLLANKADLLPGMDVHGACISDMRPAWLEAAMEWCACNGVEYVECCASDPAIDGALRLDGDQQGIARVEQALHAHMWPGMVMKARTKGSATNSVAIAEADEGDPAAIRATNELGQWMRA